jgi:bifunctional non-homologous end joining protein LigD
MTTLPVTNVDKILWPDAGFTKGAMIEYYRDVAQALVPHLEGRPLTMRRFPDGIEEWSWYQYECRDAPDFVATVDIPYRGGTPRRFCVVNDLASLTWVANLATIELHPYLARSDTLDDPSFVVFDLDPGEPADVVDCTRVALRLREELAALGLESFAKTSGSIGLHVYVPLNRPHGYERTKPFARALARRLAAEDPDAVVDRNPKDLRYGRVFVDWLQNDPSRSTIAPYSLRAMPWPTVSTPLTWDEVERVATQGRAELATFTAAEIRHRLERHGDLFAAVLHLQQELPS